MNNRDCAASAALVPALVASPASTPTALATSVIAWLVVAVGCCCAIAHHSPLQAQTQAIEREAVHASVLGEVEMPRAIGAQPKPQFDHCTMYYVWTPRMALSAQNAATPLSIARQLGLGLRVQHPAELASVEINASLTRLRSNHPRSAAFLSSSSPRRTMGSMTTNNNPSTFTHYPTVWIQRGDNSSAAVVGVMPEVYWWQTLAQLQRTLGCASASPAPASVATFPH